MTPTTKPEQRLNLSNLSHLAQASAQNRSGSSTANTSPIEQMPGPNPSRSPFAGSAAKSSAALASARTGAGSPSHDLAAAGRPFSKRAREIQASEGVVPQFWGPPASGGSTPLRETIPESPSQDGFPDFLPPETGIPTPRRPRAGTVPSRLTPAAPPGFGTPIAPTARSLRPTPSTSPFRANALVNELKVPPQSALLSRLRAGSLPQQGIPDALNPFGAALFSSAWNNDARARASTLASVRSVDMPLSPSQSSFSKEGLADADVKTLDYLGLAETPRQSHMNMARPDLAAATLQPYLNEIAGMSRNLNRLRSFSVNAKERYAGDDDSQYLPSGGYSGHNSGAMTPIDAAMAQTRAQIYHHNLAVQAFATQATANRPRARTAGVLDASLRPVVSAMRFPGNRPRQISNAIPMDWSEEFDGLPEAVQAMNLSGIPMTSLDHLGAEGQDKPTRALWLGNIPTSTTTTSLEAVFGVHGKIESSRVLMHKNCGFVNFESVDSARIARAALNGKEIFPGAGPIRIGYAKEPNSVNAGTPAHLHSASPDPNSRAHSDRHTSQMGDEQTVERNLSLLASEAVLVPSAPNIANAKSEMLQMAHDFGATADDRYMIEDSIDAALNFTAFKDEISNVPEPSQSREFDAPRLRDLRKRIDNGSMSTADIESIAVSMLPEIVELSSDYLGNTVVQKLFETCSEEIKEQMLERIGPHLAQIGVHKNGTWAAQKIIDVAKTERQMQSIVNYLRPYTVGLFLDQYGNYVLQGCLRFGAPFNNFIFETMLYRLMDIAQGRFGARAMRACLESHLVSRNQQRMIAAAVVLHGVILAANGNGALLLTWFLDTCTLPQRRTTLASRLVPHLVSLCTHKVAYLTVLKLVNQRNETEARDIILKALFPEEGMALERILLDQHYGTTLIYKVLTTPCFEESQRNDVLEKVRNTLIKLKANPNQGYKRLMDEVGLSAKVTKSDRDLKDAMGGSSGHVQQDYHQPRSRSQIGGGNGHRSSSAPHMDPSMNSNMTYYSSPPLQQSGAFAIGNGFQGNSSRLDSGNAPLLSYDHAGLAGYNGLRYQQSTGREAFPSMPVGIGGISGYPPSYMQSSFQQQQQQAQRRGQMPFHQDQQQQTQMYAAQLANPGYNPLIQYGGGLSAPGYGPSAAGPIPSQQFLQQQQQQQRQQQSDMMSNNFGGRAGQ